MKLNHFSPVWPGAAVVLLAISLAGRLHAQEVEWRAVNEASPTIVPLYEVRPSPFPLVMVKEEESSKIPVGPSPEEILRQQAMLAGTEKVRKLINSPAALVPDLSGLQFGGTIQGPKGYAVYMQKHWVRAGTRMQVPSQASESITKAINELGMLDPAGSQDFANTLAMRLRNTPSVVTITRITSQSLVLSDGRQSYAVSLRQESE